MSIFRAIFNFFYEIFGCSHGRLTRPFTLEAHTYKVCLDCGSQIYYSPDTMRPLSGREVRRMKALQASEVKVMTSASGAPVLVPTNGRKSNAA
jgi:hypothetical protein